MSSILDALRKSEAERQRGLPPTLSSSTPTFRPPPTRRRLPAWLLPTTAVAALALAWFGGLFEFGADAPEPTTERVAVAATEAAAQAAQTPVATAPTDDRTIAAPPASPSAGNESAAAPSTPAVAAAPMTATDPAAPAATLAQAPKPVATTPVPAPDPPAQDPPPMAFPGSTPAPTPDSVGPPSVPSGIDEAAPSAANPATVADATDAPMPESDASTSPGGLPSLHELPFAVRRTLPEMVVTMHLYSADPKRRFVLINGTRARDGDALDGGLQVIEIRADGIRMRHETTEFVLPVRS